MDLTGSIAHEFGHVLGFQSEVDLVATGQVSGKLVSSLNLTPYIMDLFRYSDLSVTDNGGLTPTKIIDLTADARPKFFSIDGMKNKIAEFARGFVVGNGDGFGPSHWFSGTKPDTGLPKDAPNPAIGLMTASGIQGKEILKRNLDTDKKLFDVIGWTL